MANFSFLIETSNRGKRSGYDNTFAKIQSGLKNRRIPGTFQAQKWLKSNLAKVLVMKYQIQIESRSNVNVDHNESILEIQMSAWAIVMAMSKCPTAL
jgi:hypothetical protein